MSDNREILTAKLNHQLGTLVSRVELAARNNLSSANVVAETTLTGLLNQVFGWNLVNANAISQNYPGVDLIDQERNIAVQITSTRSVEKVRNTLAKAANLGVTFQNLIVLIITNQPATPSMRDCTVPGYTGSMEIWNIPDIFRRAKELDVNRLQEIIEYLDLELGASGEVPHLELPLSSKLQASGFVGREAELNEIRSRFAQGDKLVALTGLGGIGKTELAIRYGQTHPGKVYFTRFDTSFTRTLANMAHGIRPKISDDVLREDDGVLCKRVLELLEKANPQDLLIIDNADSETGTLTDLQSDSGYAALTKLPLMLLLTIRSDTPRAIPVEPMPDTALIQIFRNHNAQLTDQEMADLIRAVNGHTMTIDLIARTLNGKGWRKVSAADILTALRENTLSSQKYRKIATDYNQSDEQAQIYEHLSVVFDLSGISDVAKNVMRCATLLPEDGMDGECFGNALHEEAQDALDILLEQGWLEIRINLLAIHPVIRLVCNTELQPTDNDCNVFLCGLIAQYDETDYQLDRYRQIAKLLTNASIILADPVGNSAIWACVLWHAVGDFAKALECSLRATKKAEKTLPSDDPILAYAYHNVGLSYGKLGNYREALDYHQKALTIREKALPPDHPELAQSYNNVGYAYSELGNYRTALDYLLKALEIREKVLPSVHLDLATSYNNIGGTYCELAEYQLALKYHQKALAIYENVLPPMHPDLAMSYNNAGTVHYNLGNYQQALHCYQKALVIQENILPDNHPHLAFSYSNIALNYHKMGDFQNAAKYMRRAADIISRSSLPKTYPEQADYANWAVQFEKDARMQQAIMAQMKQWGVKPFGLLGK